MFRKAIRTLSVASILATAGGLASPASATLTVTSQGAALGFSLTTFVSGFPFSGLGPIGLAVETNGNVLVNSIADSSNYVFANTDNQVFADHIGAGVSGIFCCGAYATSNGYTWGSQNGVLVRFNADGSIGATFNNISTSNGLWTNSVNGHLLGDNPGIIDIDVSDPNAPVATVVPGAVGGDGITVSPDGKTVYNTGITGYDIATGTIVYGPHFVSGADGMGIISSSNALNGNIVVNTNFGQLILLDPTGANPDIVIADSGSRGDYTTPDPNGTLLITQSDSIMRLSCGRDCGIGTSPPPTGAPEPITLSLFGAGLAGVGAMRRRRKIA